MAERNSYMSVENPTEDVLRMATLFVGNRRIGIGLAETNGEQDWKYGGDFMLLGEAVDVLQRSLQDTNTGG